MRAVMESAKVGDDVLGDDPTVIELLISEMFGKEAALFVASGTMANAIALRTHTVPGDEIVCDKIAHIYEGGGYAALCGASISLVEGLQSKSRKQSERPKAQVLTIQMVL